MTTTDLPARSTGLSYQQLLDTDSRGVPEILRVAGPDRAGPTSCPVEPTPRRSSTPRGGEGLEATLADGLPRGGHPQRRRLHSSTTSPAGRTSSCAPRPTTIKAFHNVCLHRGRLLKEGDCRATEFRCPFHGFGWKIDGSLMHIPCAWDFPQVDRGRVEPARRAGRHVGRLRLHQPRSRARRRSSATSASSATTSSRWPLEDRFVQVHVAKILRCNWKVAQEAFMEAMHVVATHPQILPSIGDANSQYDVFGNFSRAITANGTPSPHLRWAPTEQEMLDSMYDRNLDEPPVLTVPEGRTARAGRRRQPPRSSCARCSATTPTRCRTPRSTTASTSRCSRTSTRGARSTASSTGSGRTAMNVDECDHGVHVPVAVPARRAPTAGADPLARRRQRLDQGARSSASLARVFNQDSFNLPNVHLGLKAGRARARHVRPLRGVEDPPLAPAPRHLAHQGLRPKPGGRGTGPLSAKGRHHLVGEQRDGLGEGRRSVTPHAVAKIRHTSSKSMAAFQRSISGMTRSGVPQRLGRG